MIVAVTEQYHDYSPKMYFLDTNKLNLSNPVDARILDAVKQDGSILKLCFESDDENPEPNVSPDSQMEAGLAEKILYLEIRFE